MGRSEYYNILIGPASRWSRPGPLFTGLIWPRAFCACADHRAPPRLPAAFCPRPNNRGGGRRYGFHLGTPGGRRSAFCRRHQTRRFTPLRPPPVVKRLLSRFSPARIHHLRRGGLTDAPAGRVFVTCTAEERSNIADISAGDLVK